MSCDVATKQAAKTRGICKDLKFSTNKDVINFIQYVKDHRVSFTAAGFFTINRKIILTIAGIVVNYLVITMQFHGLYLQIF